jgi:hypothetical protein
VDLRRIWGGESGRFCSHGYRIPQTFLVAAISKNGNQTVVNEYQPAEGERLDLNFREEMGYQILPWSSVVQPAIPGKKQIIK